MGAGAAVSGLVWKAQFSEVNGLGVDKVGSMLMMVTWSVRVSGAAPSSPRMKMMKVIKCCSWHGDKDDGGPMGATGSMDRAPKGCFHWCM
ncbi:hypothetical protein V6N13_065779 [Hibiscus sabdariffa]